MLNGYRAYLSSIMVLALTSCSNYNLKEHLENPGGEKKTEVFADRLFVFVTTAVTRGDMMDLPANGCSGTGMDRADCYCQQIAQQNGRRMASTSRFVAWLSTSGTVNEMLCRILGNSGAGCAPVGSFIWYNTNYAPVFNGMSALFNAAPALSSLLSFTESGVQVVPATEDVWTGTAQQGTANTSNCNNWFINTNANLGLAGRSGNTDFAWTNSATRNCDSPLRLYCFAVP